MIAISEATEKPYRLIGLPEGRQTCPTGTWNTWEPRTLEKRVREAIGVFDIILTRKTSRAVYVVESPYSQFGTQAIKRKETRRGLVHSIGIE